MTNMQRHEPQRLVPALLLAACMAGACIDLEADPVPPIRWLTLDASPAASSTELVPPTDPRLDLTRVTVSEAIPDKLVRRVSSVEVAYDEYARWSEPLEDSVRRVLEDELYRRRGFVRASSGVDRRLEAELVSFELDGGEAHVALLAYLMDSDGSTLVDRRFESRRTVNGVDPGVVAEGLTLALSDAVAELADLVALK